MTGRFRHLAENLLDVYVEGLNESIGCTERHPFWSVTRGAWVAAGELKTGELLLTRTGRTAPVVSVNFRCGEEPVFNLEILGPHVYRVSPLALLVHNTSTLESRLCP